MTLFMTMLLQPWFTPLVTGLAVLAIVPLFIGYLSLLERKLLADFQGRYGPMRVGPRGLLQPIADGLKFLLKEDIVPSGAEKTLFVLAPLFSMVVALIGFTVLPFTRNVFIADINVGLLVIVSVTALGALGIILGGWASNSHYPLLGALRSAAQLISYEIALGLSLLAGVMAAGSLSLESIVEAQGSRHIWFLFSNYGAMVIPFAVYLMASIAETNRSPFDLPEAESELGAGYHTEFSGFRFALYMLAEWSNILVLAAAAVVLFLGGWLRPFSGIAWLELPLNGLFPFLTFLILAAYCVKISRTCFYRYECGIMWAIAVGLAFAGALYLLPPVRPLLSGLYWFFFKLSLFIYTVIWLRATLPRLRYDHLMKFGWKWLIPLGIFGIVLNAVLGMM